MSGAEMIPWLKKTVRRLFSTPQWLVPNSIVCPHCAGAMIRGRVILEKIYTIWNTDTFASVVLNYQDLDGRKVEVIRGPRLAYRCDGCAAVFITRPEVIGTPVEDCE